MSEELLDERTAIFDQMKSLPSRPLAEDADFLVWGQQFCKVLVRVLSRLRLCCDFTDTSLKDVYDRLAAALELADAREQIAAQMTEAIEAFAGFEQRDWLAWGAKLMPAFAERVAEEERIAAEEESRRRAAQIAAGFKKRAEEAAAAVAIAKTQRLAKAAEGLRSAVAAVKEDLLAGKINKEEFGRRVAAAKTERDQRVSAIEAGEESEVEPSESEPEVFDSTQATSTTLLSVRPPTKRKSDDSIGGLRAVEGSVSDCDALLVSPLMYAFV
jgi:hypothetical protein